MNLYKYTTTGRAGIHCDGSIVSIFITLAPLAMVWFINICSDTPHDLHHCSGFWLLHNECEVLEMKQISFLFLLHFIYVMHPPFFYWLQANAISS